MKKKTEWFSLLRWKAGDIFQSVKNLWFFRVVREMFRDVDCDVDACDLKHVRECGPGGKVGSDAQVMKKAHGG